MKFKTVVLLLVSFMLFVFPNSVEGNELTREEVIELALENSKEIAQLEKEQKVAQAKLREAKGALYPNFDLESSYTRLEEGPQQMGFDAQEGLIYKEGSRDHFSFALNLKQPIYLGGKLRLEIEQRKNELQAVDLKLAEKEQEIIYQVLEQYYSVLTAEKKKETADQRVRQMAHFLEVAEANKKAGLFTAADVLEARVGLNQAKQSRLEALNNLEMTREVLKNTLGLRGELKLEGKLEKENLVGNWQPEEAYEYALINRSRVQILNLEGKSLESRLEQAIRDRKYPNFNLAASYEQEGDQLEITDGTWQVSVIMNYDLFSGGQKSARESQAASRLEEFEIGIEKFRDGLWLEVKKGLLKLEEAEEKLELLKLNLEEAEQSFAEMESEFEKGIKTTADVLRVETIFREAKNDYYQGVAAYNLAQVKLNKILGLDLDQPSACN